MTSSSSSPFPATNDWTSALWQAVGWAVALGFLVVPFIVVVLLMRTRWFRRRKRVRWATRELPLLWWRSPMDRLPPMYDEDPEERRRR